jgi:signal transduction histidine kinase
VVSVTTHLGRPVTYLRLVFLLLGAALAVALSILDATLIVIADQYVQGVPLVVSAVLIVLAPIAVTLAVPPIRQVEAVAAESLLGVRFADGPPGPAQRWEERLRATTWFLLHVVAGGAAVMALVFALPLGVSFVTAPWQVAAGDHVSSLEWVRADGGSADLWMPPAGVLLLAAGLAAPLVIGVAVARLAPPLLGPSQAQRLQQLESETARLVELNRVARELHDSVGHALSVVTLQSAGARKRLSADDTEQAEAALEAIETTARAATAELDHVLGLLRDRPADERATTRPQLTLGDLDSLVAATRRAGLEVRTHVEGTLADLPPAVSREAYRIVQEGLTNALRHSAVPRAELRVVRRPEQLLITIANPAGASSRRRGGRGLTGLGERARALGGSATHRSADGTWELAVEVPLPANR